MIDLDPTLPRRLRTIESIAMISRIVSTNFIGRRVTAQCIENDNELPPSIIVADEQTSGRGRGDRTWHSPAGKGIYATILLTRPDTEISQLPFEIAVVVARFLEEIYGLAPRLKWPNDVFVDERKIAGILIEGRSRKRMVYMAIGVGINVEMMDDAPPGAVSIAEVSNREAVLVGPAREAFIEFLDDCLALPSGREETLAAWRKRSIHERGDSIECRLSDRTISGRWAGIDETGRALIDHGSERLAISSGDLIFGESGENAPTGFDQTQNVKLRP